MTKTKKIDAEQEIFEEYPPLLFAIENVSFAIDEFVANGSKIEEMPVIIPLLTRALTISGGVIADQHQRLQNCGAQKK